MHVQTSSNRPPLDIANLQTTLQIGAMDHNFSIFERGSGSNRVVSQQPSVLRLLERRIDWSVRRSSG
jgi:hypothetical protein